MSTIDIIFDGPPSNEGGRFVEVERDGVSVNIGEGMARPDGLWSLKIPVPTADGNYPPSINDPDVNVMANCYHSLMTIENERHRQAALRWLVARIEHDIFAPKIEPAPEAVR